MKETRTLEEKYSLLHDFMVAIATGDIELEDTERQFAQDAIEELREPKGQGVYFHILNVEEQPPRWDEKRGEVVEIKGFENHTFFLHLEDRNIWRVTESKSGAAVSSVYNFAENAILQAQITLYELGEERFVEAVSKTVARHGQAPAHRPITREATQ